MSKFIRTRELLTTFGAFFIEIITDPLELILAIYSSSDGHSQILATYRCFENIGTGFNNRNGFSVCIDECRITIYIYLNKPMGMFFSQGFQIGFGFITIFGNPFRFTSTGSRLFHRKATSLR